VRFIDNDGKCPFLVFTADFIENEREFLDCSDDNFFTVSEELPEIS